MNTRAVQVVAAALAMALGLWLAPVGSGAAGVLAARAAGVAALTLAVQLGLGRALLARACPSLLGRPGEHGHALAVGIGVHALLLFVLFAAGVCNGAGAVAVLVLLALPAAPALWRGYREARGAGATGWALPGWALLLVAVLLAPALFDALAPATDTDELSYLLAVPRLLALHGTLPVGILLPEAGRPLPLQLVAVAPWVLGGEAACRLWHLGVVATLIGTVASLTRARNGNAVVAAVALAGSWSVVREAGLAYNDLPVALWLVCAADAMLGARWRAMAVHAGFAFAAKYTAAPVCGGLFLVAAWDCWGGADRTAARKRLATGLALAALPILPWWARNAALGAHPLFPFAGWPAVPGMDFVFVYPLKYGLGHSWLDALLLPFNVIFRAQPDSMVFYGRLSLLWLGLLFAPIAGRDARGGGARRLLLLCVAGFTTWALGAQILRYLLPVLGIAALLLGSVRMPTAAWVLLFVGSLPSNLAPAWTRASSRAAVVTGSEDADTFLSRELPAWPALRFARAWIPAEERVALLGSWAGYYVEQPYILGSVEDHVPTRYWLALHGENALHALHDQGVRWLIVGDLPTVRKTYRFLNDQTFDAQFRQPRALLDRLLLRDARRIYAENHVAIWKLDDMADAP